MRRHVLGAFLLVGLLSVACSAPQQPSTSPTAGGAAPTQAEAQPKTGGRISLDVAFDIPNWDPTTTNRRVSYYTAFSFSRLTRFKTGPGIGYNDLILAPEVAERWEVGQDAKSFTFHLRKGVKWQNLPPVNGRELTSADVKFSLEYVGRIGEFAGKGLKPSLETWTVAGLSSIETPDPYTVVVNFKDSYAPFPSYTSTTFLSLVPREVYDQDGSFEKVRIGSGPFQLDTAASQRETLLVWKRHANYWEAGKPHLDEVRQLIIPDESTAKAAFRTKQLDMMTERIASNQVEEMKRNNPEAVAFEFTRPGPSYLWLSEKPGQLFTNQKLRQALSFAIDRQEMINTFTGGKGELALPGSLPDSFTKEETKQLLRYDPDQAKRLLAEAGYPDGVSFELQTAGNAYGEAFASSMQLLQAQVKKVGINITIKSMGATEVLAITRSGDYALAAGGTLGVFADNDSNLYGSWHPSSGNNNTKVNDPELTALIEAQRKEADPAKRKALIRQAITLGTERVHGYITLFREPVAYFWHPYVKGQYPNFASPGTTFSPYLTDTWIDK